MPIVKLSAKFVNEAVCPPEKSRVDYYDSALKGFILEARPSGGKTFYLRYHDTHGKLRQYKIGDAVVISCEKARCRIPDDCIDSKRYPLFMARAVLKELIESLQSTQGVKPC